MGRVLVLLFLFYLIFLMIIEFLWIFVRRLRCIRLSLNGLLLILFLYLRFLSMVIWLLKFFVLSLRFNFSVIRISLLRLRILFIRRVFIMVLWLLVILLVFLLVKLSLRFESRWFRLVWFVFMLSLRVKLFFEVWMFVLLFLLINGILIMERMVGRFRFLSECFIILNICENCVDIIVRFFNKFNIY